MLAADGIRSPRRRMLSPARAARPPEMRDGVERHRARPARARPRRGLRRPLRARRRGHPLRPARDLLRRARRLGACSSAARRRPRWPGTRSARSPRWWRPARSSAEDGLRLVAARGRLMQEAAEETGDGGMLAVLRGSASRWREVAAATGLTVANDNAPGPARPRPAPPTRSTRARADAASERGVRAQAPAGGRRLPLAADGAGRRAVPRRSSSGSSSREPRVPVFSCVTAAAVRRRPRAQLARGARPSPVRWRETMRALEAPAPTRFVETGPGQAC